MGDCEECGDDVVDSENSSSIPQFAVCRFGTPRAAHVVYRTLSLPIACTNYAVTDISR